MNFNSNKYKFINKTRLNDSIGIEMEWRNKEAEETTKSCISYLFRLRVMSTRIK